MAHALPARTPFLAPVTLCPDDEGLMRAAIAGDADAFHRLVDRYLPRIHRVLGRLAGWNWAEDLAQEVFLRAYERRASYREASGSFSAWIHGIARNLAIDFLRRRRSTVPLPDPSSTAGPVARNTAPDAGATDHETRVALERAIAGLPLVFRTAVVLCAIEGMSYEEAAAIEGCPAKTISSRLARGRALLRTALARHLDDPGPGPSLAEEHDA